MIPMHFDTSERDTLIPCFSKEGTPEHGTMVMRYTKDTIYVILPGSVYGMKLMPSFWFIGFCPVCGTETNAAHLIYVDKEVQKQEDVCLNCQTPSRPNPLFFPQAIALYDDNLDGIFVSSLPENYIDDFLTAVKKHVEGES